MLKNAKKLLALFLSICVVIGSAVTRLQEQESFSLDTVPAYSEQAYVVLEENVPDFSDEMGTRAGTERYSSLDVLGRCGTAFANVGPETLPTEERESIGQVKPSGWQMAKYDVVDGKYLYNRCHLIGYQLTAENANEENLITGTRYLNVEGMLPFENQVADYVKETGNHVLYRVTPMFQGTELVARGVHMEALSVEDNGAGVCFNVYVYNVQPGVEIDYQTGESWLSGKDARQSTSSESSQTPTSENRTYVLNTKSKRFHLPDCFGLEGMKEENRQTVNQTRDALLEEGYEACGQCKP